MACTLLFILNGLRRCFDRQSVSVMLSLSIRNSLDLMLRTGPELQRICKSPGELWQQTKSDCKRTCRGDNLYDSLRRNGSLAGKARDQGAEDDQAVGGAEWRFDGALGVGHQSENVALAVADSGDGCERAIRICVEILRAGRAAVGMNVAKNNLPVALEFGKRLRIAEIVPFHVRDGHFQHLAGLRGTGKRSVRIFDADVHLAAKKAQVLVAHHGARKQAALEKNLESVADAEDESAGARKTRHRAHHRRKLGDGAGAQIVAERKAAGKDDHIETGDLLGLMPDEFDRLTEDGRDGMKGVVVAIRSGKLDYAKFHSETSFYHACSMILRPGKDSRKAHRERGAR